MTSNSNHTPAMKIIATGVGAALCSVEVWLNAEHIAHLEGWASSLVAAVVAASIGAAAALPLAERAAKSKQGGKAIGLLIFFMLMVCFSFTASVDRVGGKRDAETAGARGDNNRVVLLREGYEAAKKTAAAECASGQGRRCRTAEEALNKVREALAEKPVERVENSAALRISSALPFITAADVELYQPLVLPLGLQLGGFLMLALGLAPRREEPEPKSKTKPRAKVTPKMQEKKAPRKKPAAKAKAPAKTPAERQRDYRARQKELKLTVVNG